MIVAIVRCINRERHLVCTGTCSKYGLVYLTLAIDDWQGPITNSMPSTRVSSRKAFYPAGLWNKPIILPIKARSRPHLLMVQWVLQANSQWKDCHPFSIAWLMASQVVAPKWTVPHFLGLGWSPDGSPHPRSTSGAGNVAPSQFLKEGLVTRGDARQVSLVAMEKSWLTGFEKEFGTYLRHLAKKRNAGNVPPSIAADERLKIPI